jgi:hypothetical protein
LARIWSARNNAHGITIYSGYQQDGDAPAVFAAEDILDIHILPFFGQKATTGKNAKPDITSALDYFTKHGNGKLIRYYERAFSSTLVCHTSCAN